MEKTKAGVIVFNNTLGWGRDIISKVEYNDTPPIVIKIYRRYKDFNLIGFKLYKIIINGKE